MATRPLPIAIPSAGWRSSPRSCWPTSRRRPSTSCRTTTARNASRWCCRRACPTCWSTVRPVSPSAWPPISRRITSARWWMPCSTCLSIRAAPSKTSSSACRRPTSPPRASSTASPARTKATAPAAGAWWCARERTSRRSGRADGQPKVLNLKDLIEAFISHRREVVTRRTVFQLRQARARGHVLEGLAVALSNVDEVVDLVKKAPSPADAKRGLMDRAWPSDLVRTMIGDKPAAQFKPEGLNEAYGLKTDGYRLSDEQAQAILELRLQRLTGLERDKIREEYKEVIVTIADLLDILAKPARITKIIGDELKTLKEAFADKRKSEIVTVAEDISIEDLIAPQDMVVTFSHGGYVKSQPLTEYKAQRRGGRGRMATTMKEDDFIERLFVAHSHDYLLCFSNRGKLYWLKVFEVPAGSRTSKGKPLVNVFPLTEGEKITAVVPVKEFDENHFVFMATAQGTVKKTPLAEFSRPRPSGIIAVGLDEDDYLVGAALTDGKFDVMLFSSEGKAVRFEESDVRPMGRQAGGVRGMRLGDGQRGVCMLAAHDESKSVLTATEHGFGKRTALGEY